MNCYARRVECSSLVKGNFDFFVKICFNIYSSAIFEGRKQDCLKWCRQRDWERISATTTVCVQVINHITIQLLLPNSYFIALFLSVHSYLTPIFSTFFPLSSILYLLFFTPTFSFSLLPVCDLSWHLVESSSRSKGLEGRAQAHHPTSAHTLSVA